MEKEQQELAALRRVHEETRLVGETNRIKDAELISVLKKSIDELNSDKVSCQRAFELLFVDTNSCLFLDEAGSRGIPVALQKHGSDARFEQL